MMNIYHYCVEVVDMNTISISRYDGIINLTSASFKSGMYREYVRDEIEALIGGRIEPFRKMTILSLTIVGEVKI